MIGPARWLPAIAVASGIFWFSHQPASDLPGTGFDKIQHAIAYGVLAATLWFGQAGRLLALQGALKRGVTTVVVAALYGLSDELHQSFIAGRDPSLMDWVADVVGALLVVGMLVGAAFADLRGVWENRHR